MNYPLPPSKTVYVPGEDAGLEHESDEIQPETRQPVRYIRGAFGGHGSVWAGYGWIRPSPDGWIK